MSMFCFQCEQTAFHKACTQKGVCGKEPDTANLQDELTSSVIKLANCGDINDENTKLIIDGLFATITNVNFDNKSIENLTEKFKNRISCDFKFDVKDIWDCSEDLRSLKSLILFGLKGMAAYAHHAWILGYKSEEVNNFFYEALKELAKETSSDELTKLVLKVGRIT